MKITKLKILLSSIKISLVLAVFQRKILEFTVFERIYCFGAALWDTWCETKHFNKIENLKEKLERGGEIASMDTVIVM